MDHLCTKFKNQDTYSMQTMIYCGECNHRGDCNIGVAVNTGLMGNSVVIVNAGLFVNTGVSEKNTGMIVIPG
jgi:hypothetical protein